MDFEIEFKLINIKDISKIQRIEKCEDPFGGGTEAECEHDITDEYCTDILQNAIKKTGIDCGYRFIGCTERIGYYEFEVSYSGRIYIVVFKQDTYEKYMQLSVEIGYKKIDNKNESGVGTENNVKTIGDNINRKKADYTDYDVFLEKLKLSIKDKMVRDWFKCIWLVDNQSMHLSREVYSEIYEAENELRAFVSKVMIKNLGPDWHDRPEFSKLGASIELNAGNIKRSVPSFANIDVNLYTATLETLMDTVKSDIYMDEIPIDPEIQRLIKNKIFSTTQLNKMQSALDYMRSVYIKKYNIWDKFFTPFIDDLQRFEKGLSNFVKNRNHVAHNKLIDFSAKNKILIDTKEFRRFIKNAVDKFEEANYSEELQETFQAIEEQKEYEREALLEIIESEAGVSIRNRKEILELFAEVIHDIYNRLYETLYFNDEMDVDEKNIIRDETDEQLLFEVRIGKRRMLSIYCILDIDDSDGMTSTLKISVIGENEETVVTEVIEYTNGEAEYNTEQTSYMPSVKDFLDDGNKENVIEAIDVFLRWKMEMFDIDENR